MIFKKLAKDTMVYGLGDMLGKLVTFISFPIIATVLSASDFGTLDLILTSGTLVGIFIGCGLNNAIARFYWDEDVTPEDRLALVSTGLFLQVALGLVLLVIALLSMPFVFDVLNQNYVLSFGLMALISVSIMVPLLQWTQYMRDILRLKLAPWKFTFMSICTKTVAAVSGVVAVVFFKAGIDGYLLAQALALILIIPLSIWFIRKDVVFVISTKWIKALLQYGFPFIYVGMAYWVFSSIDRWMLASLSSIEETGIYSIAARFSSLVLFVSMAFGQAWSPNAVKIKTDYPDSYRDLYAKIFLLLLYIMLLIGGGIAIFSKEIIFIILPDEYMGATFPMAILCFGIIVQSTQQITGVGISLEKKTKIFGYMAWATALANVVLNYLLIPHWGASGAAFATLMSYVILTVGYLYFTQRVHPLPFSITKISWLVFLGAIIAIFIYKLDSFELSLGLASIKLLIMFSVLLLGIIIFKQDILEAKNKFLEGRRLEKT